MSFNTFKSEAFAPLFRGLSLLACIGTVAAVLAFDTATGSPVPPTASRSEKVLSAIKPTPQNTPLAPWAGWRLGKAEGVHYIEFDWQPRNKPLPVR